MRGIHDRHNNQEDFTHAMTRTLRACTLAIAACLASTAALAIPLAAPDASFTIDVPAAKKWKMELAPQGTPADTKLWVAGDGEQYCFFNVKQRPDTAQSAPGDVVRSMQPALTADKWAAAATPFFDILFSKSVPVAKNAAVEMVNGWPIQVTSLDGYKYGPVIAALHMRPGVEVQSYCSWEDGKDHAAEFKSIALSVATAKDAEWQAAITSANAAAAQAAAAAAAAPPPPPPAKKK
jgi:hypothetical protein